MYRRARFLTKSILAAVWAAALCALTQHPVLVADMLPSSDPFFGAGENLAFFPVIIQKYPDPIGGLQNEWFLMVDDTHILARDVARVYHPFKKYPGNPVLKADRTWEGIVVQIYGTVLPGFRMWYSTYSHITRSTHVLYADSKDGLTWRKPSLNGTNRNVLLNGARSALPSLIHTPHDLEKPYKLIVYQGGVFNGYGSIDGIAVSPYLENPLFANASDVAQFYWDSNLHRYRGTAKERVPVHEVPRRAVRFVESDDLLSWSAQPELLVPDDIDEEIYSGFYPHFYGLPVFPIGEQYLGLLWILKAKDLAGEFGQTHIQLISSHDGVHWIREEGNRPPILDHGQPGEWDCGQIYTSNRPLKVGDELWLYYSGCDQEHSINLPKTVCSIGLATAGYNRLASLTGTGAILTEVLSPRGPTLHLNYDGSQGRIRVQISLEGVPIPGYEAENCLPMTKNSQDEIVRWVSGSRLPDYPFQIEFLLENSSLFAFAMMEN